MKEESEFDPTTGELIDKPSESEMTPVHEEVTSSSYIERVLSNTLRISIHRITNSGIYKFAQQSFSFSRKFTITKTVGTSLMAQGTFGVILMILLIPLALLFDVTILIGGICLGSILFLLIFMVFVFVFLFLIVKSLFNL